MARSIVAMGIGLLTLACGTSSPDQANTAGSNINTCGSDSGTGDSGTGTDAARDTGATHSVALTWVASVTPGVTYRVHRSQGCTGTYVEQASGLTITNWTDLVVTSGQTYCYVATAVDANGESVDSNTAKAAIP